ncbi:65-kDa microtubule-associated protein 5-like [Pyrus ussuriensis x Pyrus communis]|uniref:65-kDa microtubule-associated protein 5-like n=1 Tax=Pyrus ussuriensis x Pyrus communis TaxID=2448454 RepID=A0A5N5HM97_9ROSA|nr:65-kDa microtubule-associated protein 5-like [Pyrus ussuriensis x Pyrus communis]
MTRKHRAYLHRYLPDGQTQIKAIISAFGEESEEDKRKSRVCLDLLLLLTQQFNAKQEAIFGSRPSTKKPLGQSTNANTMVGTPISRVHP